MTVSLIADLLPHGPRFNMVLKVVLFPNYSIGRETGDRPMGVIA